AEADSARAALAFEQKQLEALEKLSRVIKSGVDDKTVMEKQKAVATAKAQLAAATAAIDNAKATLEVKQSKVTEGEAALATAKAEVEMAELALERARHAVAQTRLVAAFDGVVTERNVRAGYRVQATESGRPMLTIQRTDKVLVVAGVKEDDAALTERGVEADV